MQGCVIWKLDCGWRIHFQDGSTHIAVDKKPHFLIGFWQELQFLSILCSPSVCLIFQMTSRMSWLLLEWVLERESASPRRKLQRLSYPSLVRHTSSLPLLSIHLKQVTKSGPHYRGRELVSTLWGEIVRMCEHIFKLLHQLYLFSFT